MKRNQIICTLLCACLLLLCCPLTAGAVDENYATFDYRAYANIYPDLKAAYGYNAEKLYAHYINYGKAEGRIGGYISGDNPKQNAPVYADLADAGRATLLNPLPPTELAKQPDWAQRRVIGFRDMSNVRLVAEYLSSKAYMAEAWAASEARDNGAAFSEKENWLNDTVQRYAERIEQELLLRVRAVEENNPELSTGAMGKVGERAMASDTTILRQWSSQYAGLAAPPADPGKAGAAQTPTVGGFNDVPENAYFAKAVLWAVEKEITGGTDQGVFSPGQTCTKGQILTFLWRANGSPEPQSAALDGVDSGAFYYKAALWADEQGLLGDGFSFDSPCTRSMAVTYLWKLAGSPAVMANSFDDVAADADYAAAVAWAVEKQITGGTGDRQFSPGQTCTRAEIVTFLWRAFTD